METVITKIDVEEPHIHWEHINVQNKRVLDLGCGDFGRAMDLPYPTTAEYFIQEGASYVLGIDGNSGDIGQLLKNTGDKLEVRYLMINSPNQIFELITNNQIQIVKSDIEGAEEHLLTMDDADFSLVEEYYIETHSDVLETGFLEKFARCGYNVYHKIILIHTHDRCKVLFARK